MGRLHKRLESIKQVVKEHFKDNPNVLSVGIGGDYVVNVYLEKCQPGLPRTIHFYEIEYIVTGLIGAS